MLPLRSLPRLLALGAFVGVNILGGCGDDSATRAARGTGGSETLTPPVMTGGTASGGAPVATGGAALATGGTALATGGATGGTTMMAGSGGMIENLGGMGGEGPTGPIEPPVLPCEPLAPPAPRHECPMGPFPALPLLAQEEEVVLCTRSMNVEWAEGPIWRAGENRLLFSNFDESDVDGLFNGNLMTYQEGEGCSDLFTEVGTNGLALGPPGTLIVGRQTNRTLSRLDLATGEFCSLADSFEDKRLSSPNDVAVRSDGNIYFSDPAWNLGDRDEELPQSLYRISPDGELLLISVYDEMRPNGVSLSPDENLLYLAIEGAIVVFDVDETGALSGERDFVTGINVDGMALDCAGNIYTSTGGVYSKEAELLGQFWGGTNLAFGGPDGQTLFITGHRRLTSLRVAIPGLPY